MFEEALDQADKELQAEEERKAGQEKARAAMRARTTVKEKYGRLTTSGRGERKREREEEDVTQPLHALFETKPP
jgi:hypothetical protein